MIKPIEELKVLVVDGMKFKVDGKEIAIRRYANNVLRVNGKLCSWYELQAHLIDGDWELIINEKELDLLADAHQEPTKKNQGLGGRRPGAGRKKKFKFEKKKPSLFTLSPEALNALEYLCDLFGEKKSGMVESLIIDSANKFGINNPLREK